MDNNTNNWKEFTLGNPQEEQPRRVAKRSKRKPLLALLIVAALAVGADLMRTYGPDSLVGRTAAVMLGSTETTFYAVSVYFGAAGVRKTRYTLPAALIADLTGFLAAAVSTRLFF